MHDSQVAIDLVKQSKRAFPNIKRVVADAGYKTPKFVHFLSHLKLYPILPYTAPHGVKGMFRKKTLFMMPILTAIYVPIINRCYFQLSLVMVIEPINQIQNSV